MARPSGKGNQTHAPEASLGNQATLRGLAGVQPKLAMGAANDPLEHEAEHVADQVMRMADGTPPVTASAPRISRKTAEGAAAAGKTGAKQARDGGEAPGIVQDAIRPSGQPLDAAARAMFEPRFGRDFSQIRIHTGTAAAESARAIGARAYTAGNDIVFGENQYRPHDAAGTRLLAHELTHTVQQGGGAAALVQRDFHWPWESDIDFDDLRSTVHKTISNQSFTDMMNKIGTPQLHKTILLNYADTLDADYIKRAIDALGTRELSDIAGSAEGTEVLQHMLARLPAGAPEHGTLESVLSSRTGPTAIKPTVMTPADIAAIDRINKALSTDPHMADYAAAKVPLRFPVEIYTAGLAQDGGVYYDPHLGTAGETPLVGYHQSIALDKSTSKTTRTQFPLLYIKLGPDALSFSDTFIRATLFHEFVHYSRLNEFRGDEAGKSAETKELELEAQIMPAGSPLDSHETEATSKELAEYGAKMNDGEVKSNLLYLSRFLGAANPNFKAPAVDRIVAAARAAGQVQRYIKLIDGLHDKARRTALKPLRDALATLPAKKKP